MPMLVDPDKLDVMRELADASVTERALINQVDRHQAAQAVAMGLDHAMRVLHLHERYVAYVIPLEHRSMAIKFAMDGAIEAAADYELDRRCPWYFESTSRSDAELATLCKLIHNEVDVAMPLDKQQRLFGMDGWQTTQDGWRQALVNYWLEIYIDSIKTRATVAKSIAEHIEADASKTT
jgi:hypothetical protein